MGGKGSMVTLARFDSTIRKIQKDIVDRWFSDTFLRLCKDLPAS